MKKLKKMYDQLKKKKGLLLRRFRLWVAYSSAKWFIVGFLVVLLSFVAFLSYNTMKPVDIDINYTDFLTYVDEDQINNITMYSDLDYFIIELKDGTRYNVPNPNYDEFKKDIYSLGIDVVIQKTTVAGAIIGSFVVIPTLIFLAFILVLFIQNIGALFRSYYTVIQPKDGGKFEDIAGLDEIKEDVQFMVDLVKNPDKYKDCGVAVPKGALLVGPPGNGKTLIAKALAGEAGVPFISCCGSDFGEMFYGLGAKRIRGIIQQAIELAPCVLFIDEIDAFGTKRNSSDSVSMDTSNTLNTLLQKMDGVDCVSKGILFVAATNRLEELDPALVRPGRFDRIITINPPFRSDDVRDIIQVHLRNKKVAEDLDLDFIVALLSGSTGAEIANVINESVLVSLARGHDGVIHTKDLDTAFDKIIQKGNPKKIVRNEHLKRIAYHEAGHTLMALLQGITVQKVSIIPNTSGMGGMTLILNNSADNQLQTEQDLCNKVQQNYGGMAAEKLIYGSHSVGCYGDIQKVTEIVARMTTKYAMGATLLDLSQIDKSVVAKHMETLTKQQLEETMRLLNEHIYMLHQIANDLMEQEVLYGVKPSKYLKNS